MAVYSISNNEISFSVNSFGAELISFKHKDAELLWQSDKNVWSRYAPVLFPIVGKLKSNSFSCQNTNYNLPQHGFARDTEFVLVEKIENALEFELTANEETQSKYPFHFSLRIRYELNGSVLQTKYSVFNPGNADLFFSIGAHPGFNCKRVADESLNDFYLEFDNKKQLIAEKLNDGLLGGQTSVITLESNKLPLSTKLFEQDALVFKNMQIESVKLCSLKSKLKIVMTCKGWPYFGIWTKKGSDAFICLEPWFGIADSVNSKGSLESKEGIICLKPYASWQSSFSLEISL